MVMCMGVTGSNPGHYPIVGGGFFRRTCHIYYNLFIISSCGEAVNYGLYVSPPFEIASHVK